MELRKFIPQGGVKDFAKCLDVHPKYLYRLMNGKRPGHRIAVKIEESTEGMVTLEDLGYSDEEAQAIRVFQRATTNTAA